MTSTSQALSRSPWSIWRRARRLCWCMAMYESWTTRGRSYRQTPAMSARSRDLILTETGINQPTVFMRAAALKAAGLLETGLHYTMDYALWIRMGRQGDLLPVHSTLAGFRIHPSSKSGSVGYRFRMEQVQWLQSWLPASGVLAEEDVAEALRRMRVRAVSEFVFAGNVTAAAEQMSLALESRAWPFGSARGLAIWLAGAQGLGGQHLSRSEAFLAILGQSLGQARPRDMAKTLWRLTTSQWHMVQVFTAHDWTRPEVRAHLWQAIQRDPAWLGNRGIQSILVEAVAGRRIARALRRAL